MAYSNNPIAIKARERYHSDEEYRHRVIQYNNKWKTQAIKDGKIIPWEKLHPKRYAEICKKSRDKTKLQVLSHYGGNPPKCACCGITDIRVLNIDHINNDGARHRKQIGSLGSRFYSWLKVHNFPEGYQILCFNCNWIKRLEIENKNVSI